jgi:hypothetical protein
MYFFIIKIKSGQEAGTGNGPGVCSQTDKPSWPFLFFNAL